ncbi:MAG TPA: tRNA-dihydrouridine synthase [Candidatus Moranbacteria bacterium]|nr:tRNA-dihydrouridine synthase [Candidatus Moranbacteria bacterium]
MVNFWLKLNKPILVLAPMAGVTDSAFRQICRKYGADVVYSEMASATALFYNPEKTLSLVKFTGKERPYVVQLFGKDPKHFAQATKIISQQLKPDGIDINFGCPAKKVFGHGSGSALMLQKKLAREIIKAVCENTKLPVSLKIRAGVKDISALEFIKNTADLPYSTIMVHGRTYENKFSGPVNFEVMEQIKKTFPQKIVLGNGGIFSAQDAKNTLERYSLLDGLGLARGVYGHPWIFNEIKELLNKNKATLWKLDFQKIKKIALEHTQLLHKNKGQRGLFEMRKHLGWYAKGFPGAASLRKKLVLAESLEEIKKILDSV